MTLFLIHKSKMVIFLLRYLKRQKVIPKKDIKEYFHIYPWGRIPLQLKDEILEYYRLTSELAAELLDWVEANSPTEVAEKYSEALSNMIKDTPNTLLRVLHYPPLKGDEEVGAVRAAAHEDINLINYFTCG